MNNIKKNVNKGFSLVELIVVIAIMAVLTAVLAPSLLAYVERSRAQKDDSAMAEVTNAVMLALADQNVYDEVLCFTCKNNVSCFDDSSAKDAEKAADNTTLVNKIITRKGTPDTAEQWMLNDNCRLEDEEIFTPVGNMRGVTITFEPYVSTNKSYYVIAEGIINKHISASVLPIDGAYPAVDATANGGDNDGKMELSEMASFNELKNHYLYNRVRATVGDTIDLTSQTYRNSEYTIFIRMGTTGGNRDFAQDAIMVYGQWNGTNLSR